MFSGYLAPSIWCSFNHRFSCLMCSRSSSSSIKTAALPSWCPNSLSANKIILSILVLVLVIDISPSVGCAGFGVEFYDDLRLIDFD